MALIPAAMVAQLKAHPGRGAASVHSDVQASELLCLALIVKLHLTHCSSLCLCAQNGDIKEVMEKADKMAAEIAGKA